ncbi:MULTISPECIES: HD domain-containing phosphohydrolase [unclassified Mesotoga]|uniref:HD domain-containing phosphohydrolase n=1 Tax=unclassified Mesotoga TaxID=1184398 RepID=UPI0025CEAB21|nr:MULTISPECIES: HD domain-containing phosphohydrolase [unclassified Mesotoga]
MKNSRICGLALRFNYDDPESFRSELRAILDEEDLSREDLGILVALDFVYSQTFDETGVFDFSDVESELLAEGLYFLAYFFARNSEDKIAYLVSKLAVDLIAKECGKEQEINLKMLHMMTSFEMGFGEETLSLFAELVKLEEYVPTQKRFEYYNDLGLVSTQLQTGDNPWKFYERAKEVAESPVRMLMVQLNMIDYLYSKNRFAEAIELLDLVQGCNFEAVSIKGYKLMINLKILLQLNDLSRAAVIAEQLESLINSHIEWTDIAVSYIFLGHFYVKSGNVSRAENYLNQLKSLPDESLTSYIKGETLILEASIMQVKGEHFRALENSVGAFESLTLYSTTSPHLKDFVNNLFESISSIFGQLIRELRLKDDYTALHTLRVLKICYEFGKELDLEKIDLFNLSIGAMLHDYGKVDIPFDTLNKPSALTEEEFTEIKRHPVYGERYLRDLNFPKAVRDIVRHHHERIDGNGYPDGLKGNEIHMLVQIVAVADVFDALTTDRPYRKAITKARALKYLEEKGDQLISKGLLTRFIEFSQRKEISVKEEEITALWRSIISELFK